MYVYALIQVISIKIIQFAHKNKLYKNFQSHVSEIRISDIRNPNVVYGKFKLRYHCIHFIWDFWFYSTEEPL